MVAVDYLSKAVYNTLLRLAAMSEYLFHYTTRANAQVALASGIIRPPLGGLLYLTDTLYGNGADARNGLALELNPPEVCLAVERSNVLGLMGPTPVKPKLVFRGGATEYTTRLAVSLTGAEKIDLISP